MSDYSRGSGGPMSSTSATTAAGNTTRTDSKRFPPKSEQRVPKIVKKSGLSSPSREKNQESIKDAIEDLKNFSILRDFSGNDDIGFLSEEALSGMGFTMVETEELTTSGGSLKDFTLINTKNDETEILNSKIIDPNVTSLTPEKAKTIEKFKSETDKFYELDDERPISIKTEEKISPVVAKKKMLVAKKIIPRVRKSKNTHLPRRRRRARIKKGN